MRQAGLDAEEVDGIAAASEARRVDEAGNPIAIGRDSDGRLVEVVIALDDPGYVITVIARRKWR